MIVDNKWLKHKTLCNKRLLLTGKVCRTFLAEESVVRKRGMFFLRRFLFHTHLKFVRKSFRGGC